MKAYKGNIISCDANHSVYEYLVEDKGKIVFLGNQLPGEYQGLHITELGKKALLPSFTDTHLHFSSYAFFASNLDIRKADSYDEIRQLIKEYISDNKPRYVLAFGASAHNVKEKQLITLMELDKVNPEVPVMIVKYDGHACVVNSAMLKILPGETEQVVNAFDFALKDFPRDDHRHIIIHAPLTTTRCLEKAAELNLGIASQPAFIHWSQEPLEYLEEIIGDRAYRLFNQNDMLNLGLKVSGGSDAPCTLPDIGESLFCACNHYVSDQSVSIEEALRFFTWNAAWISFDEKERGSLEKGKIADMCILNENPLTLHKSKLRSIKSEKLILNGNDYVPGQDIGELLLRRLFGKKRVC